LNLIFHKKSIKIPKHRSSCHESNGVKNFQIFIRLVHFVSIRSSTKKRKRFDGNCSNRSGKQLPRAGGITLTVGKKTLVAMPLRQHRLDQSLVIPTVNLRTAARERPRRRWCT
jgi:hypothetical protein